MAAASVNYGIADLRVSQDFFLCSTQDHGVRVYCARSAKCVSTIPETVAGTVKMVDMVHPSGLLVIVGGGRTPLFESDGVIAFLKCADNTVAYKQELPGRILNMKVQHECVVVMLRDRIYLFSVDCPVRQLCEIPTRDNPMSVCALEKDMLALPHRSEAPGCLQIVDISQRLQPAYSHGHRTAGSSSSSQPIRKLMVAKHEVAIAAFNSSASMLATASTHGTLVRIFSVLSLDQVHEYRRGTEPATIFYLGFNPMSSLLVVASDKGTFHVFDIAEQSNNQSGILAAAAGALARVPAALYSYKKFTMSEPGPFRCHFLDDDELLLLSYSGTAYLSKLMNGQDCKPNVYFIFFNQYLNADL
eukprot:scpid79570/ scgid35137/ WD repeat domain phosphoinositide-interacting protein 4; WD repeat domain X-linked 1; WD repeat-containing protein 45